MNLENKFKRLLIFEIMINMIHKRGMQTNSFDIP